MALWRTGCRLPSMSAKILRAKLRPRSQGWSAHRRPFAFETGPIDPRDDSFRYLNGTPHIPPACMRASPGLAILNKDWHCGHSRKIHAHEPRGSSQAPSRASVGG